MSFNLPELRFKTEVKNDDDDMFTIVMINSHDLSSITENNNLNDTKVIVAPCGEDIAY